MDARWRGCHAARHPRLGPSLSAPDVSNEAIISLDIDRVGIDDPVGGIIDDPTVGAIRAGLKATTGAAKRDGIQLRAGRGDCQTEIVFAMILPHAGERMARGGHGGLLGLPLTVNCAAAAYGSGEQKRNDYEGSHPYLSAQRRCA